MIIVVIILQKARLSTSFLFFLGVLAFVIAIANKPHFQPRLNKVIHKAHFLFGITCALVVEKGKTHVAADNIPTQKVGF